MSRIETQDAAKGLLPKQRRAELNEILRGVSRSFYLTLRVVPRAMRAPLSTGYLFCRAADTIADTRLLPREERVELLETYRAWFADETLPAAEDLKAFAARVVGSSKVEKERLLLERLSDCFAAYADCGAEDRDRLRRLVTTLTGGMQMDLERFPVEESGEVDSLDTDEELDHYCYLVAGCVGEFWTDVQCGHLRALKHWDAQEFRTRGIRFGKGLQMTNILRDIDSDFGIGRLYIPKVALEPAGLDAKSLRDSDDRSALRPLVHRYLKLTLDHYREGIHYTLAIPRRLVTLRLACIWPLWIGLETLTRIAQADDPCAPGVVHKITRKEVKALMRKSSLRVGSNRALSKVTEKLEGKLLSALEA
ncbi:MAG: phytoene/squalene synthase family protein [Planctomycetota bacterium]